MSDQRQNLMHKLHAQAWEIWERRGETSEEFPDFSVLTYDEMNSLQYWDMPGLPSMAHDALLEVMHERWQETDPCVTCGHRSPA